MGFFSWITQDTEESIANVYSSQFKGKHVYMMDNQENVWTEKTYEGYGIFGGKDYYELLAEMNGYSTREAGIDIEFGDIVIENVLYPNLVHNANWKWKNKKPKQCPYQGYFY